MPLALLGDSWMSKLCAQEEGIKLAKKSVLFWDPKKNNNSIEGAV